MFFFYLLESSYAAFHDEEWGVPVHDDKYAYLTFYQFGFFFCTCKSK